MSKRKTSLWMLSIVSVIIFIFVAGCGQTVMEEQPVEDSTTGGELQGNASLETSLDVTTEAGKVFFELHVKNNGENDVKLQFPSGQMFEIVGKNAQGQEVYRYSINKLFTQALTTVAIKAGETHTWKEELDVEAQGVSLQGIMSLEAVVLAEKELNGLTIDENSLKGSATVEIQADEEAIQDNGSDEATEDNMSSDEALENDAFRNIKVEGENGVYTVTGEARVFEATFGYSVSDGHKYYVEDFTTASTGAPEWGTFTLNIDISEDKLPISGKVMLELFEESAKDGARINELFVTLQWIK